MVTRCHLEIQGVFQVVKNETQQAITNEDWTTDGSLVMHQSSTIYA